jgi:hypothetical protein
VLVTGNPLEASLMFVGKAGAYLGEAHFMCSTFGEAPTVVFDFEASSLTC